MRFTSGPGAPPQLRFEPIDRDLGAVLVGERNPVRFRVVNGDASRPARVLGVEQRCDADGCLFWRGSPTTIPPGGEAIVEVEWKGVKPGRLVQRFPVFTDCPGQTEVHLTVAGDVVSLASPSPP